MDRFGLAASGERDGLWDWDLVSNRVHFSPRWISMVGCDDGEVGNSPEEWLGRVHSDDQTRVRREIETRLATGASDFDIHHRMRQPNGTYRWMTCRGVVVRDSDGLAVRLVGSHADITTEHVADPLTGLPNRVLFLDRVARSIDRARRNPDFLYAVLLVDIDRPIPEEPARQPDNDPLLTASARRLESCLRGEEHAPFPGDDYVVARLRGSQFALLLEGLNRVGEAQAAAERVLAGLLAPFQLRGHQVFPRASIGIVVSAAGYERTEDVMRDADAALYRARSLGGNRCEVFDIDLVQSAAARLELEVDLKQALDRHEFLLFYQPVLEAASNRIVGLEALARWQHPTRGMIPPQEFIPLAEQTGVIVDLGNWTLREACRQLKAWQVSLPAARDLWISVNFSSEQFRQPDIVEQVREVLRDTELNPQCLMLELTESVVMSDPATAKTLLMQLRVMGVRIGIDDFGTGHSSFAYLHQFPADFLKVDQSFIRGMEVRQDKADIVGTVAGLAGQLGLRVIAEGIESEAGLDLIRSRRCDYVQGFLFSRPVDAAAAAELITNGVPSLAESRAEGVEPPPSFPEAVPQQPEVGQRTGLPKRNLYRFVGLSAAVLVIAAGLAIRSTPRPAAPVVSSVGRAESNPAEEVGPGALPSTAMAPSSAEIGPTKAAAAKATATKVKPRALQPATVALTVEHQHVFGGCQGILRVSPSGVSYVSDSAKDAFTLKYGRLQSTLGDDTLTIKSDKKTYRFKAAKTQLRRATTAIEGFRPK